MDSAAPDLRAVPPGEELEDVILAVVSHARYRGDFVPVWRILDAAGVSARPAAIHGALQRLEARGSVERRRGPSRQLEWRVVEPPPTGP